jgi:FtsP/CotA-like multicopper oxidase with cupredoxin domain
MKTRRTIILTSGAALALAWGTAQGLAQPLTLSPGVDYTKPNYAYSGPIQKFVDTLPGLTPAGINGVGQYIPLAIANTPYGTPYGATCDYYEVGLVEYIEHMHTSLPASGTKLRGYVQIVPSTYPGAVPLTPAHGCTMNVTNGAGAQMYGADKPHYLGPLILSTKNRAVRIKFMNLLPTGTKGNLFLPVDTTTILGAGNGWHQTGTDPNGMPIYEKYTQNRATLHLHGGLPPWVSDGTAHQWITPAGENTTYKKGASAADVPDMSPPGGEPGVMTFYWPNQMSGRLMFYHDHAWGMTGVDVYAGEAAGYVVLDPVEETALATAGVPGTIVTAPATGGIVSADLAHLVPLVIQDKTFVPSPAAVATQDPNWTSDVKDNMTGVAPTEGNLWYPHVYIPNQWPSNPDGSGANPFGRWDWGPWFWPIWPLAPGVAPPTVSHTPEAFMDTMVVNGQPYPYLNVAATKYRLRILNACNDRMVNLQLYKATPGIVTNIVVTAGGSGYDPLVPPFVIITGGGGRGASATAMVSGAGVVTNVTVDIVGSGYATVPTVSIAAPAAGTVATATAQIYTLPTEVGMVPASPTAGVNFPAGWSIQTIPYTPDILDGRIGGVPDPTNRGPAFVQIGTEGGFLPAPVVLPNTPVGYEQNKKNIVVLNVKEKTLHLAPAERADAIVDFSQFAGQTVILYNDSGAPVPAADGRCDLFTGNPDYTGQGGAPSTLAGMGPSTRTIMAFKVAGTPGPTIPDYYDPALLTALNTTLPALFKTEQPAPVVPEAAFNAIGYAGGTTTNTYSHIQNTSLTFVPYGSTTPITMQMQPKTIQELFDDVGRLNATLGTELPFTTAQIQTTVPLNFVDPATEIFNDGETQIWKITHNGVDSHGVHFHLFDVQLINRVGWDGQITPPDPNERGWKDTVRMNPLEDIIVAMRAVKPNLTSAGFSVLNSGRLLNPAAPTNSLTGFSNLDPLTGNAFVPPVSNIWTSFGWEYTWHCHILGHEENDMMRPVVMNVVDTVPVAPTLLTATLQIVPPLRQASLAWTDNAVNEAGFEIWRKVDGGAFVLLGKAAANATKYIDTTITTGNISYEVRAYNQTGPSPFSNIASVNVNVAPLTPTQISPNGPGYGPQPVYTFLTTPGAVGYRVAVTNMAGGPATTTAFFTQAQVDPGNTGTGTIPQATPLALGSYSWQIQARNANGSSPWSGFMAFTVAVPIAPTPISPTGSGIGTTPAYTFNTVVGATGYRLYLVDYATQTPILTRWYLPTEVDPTSTGIGSITLGTLTPGAYRWYVQAENGALLSPWSVIMNFSVGTPPPAPTPISPPGSGIGTTPTYTFNTVVGATGYSLYLVDYATETPILTRWYTPTEVDPSSTGIGRIILGTLTPGAYRWYVQAENGAGPGPWSVIMNFSVP